MATLRIDLRLVDCRSPGRRRRLLRRLFVKICRRSNVSVAEVDRADAPDGATIGLAAVAATRREARESVERILEAVADHPRAEVIGHSLTEV